MCELYHRKIKWNKNFDKSYNEMLSTKPYIQYSQHFSQRFKEKGFNLKLFEQALYSIKYQHKGYLFEVGVENNIPYKFVVRTKYDDSQDIVFVLKKINKSVLLVTAWLNENDDNHYTLDRSKYICN